MIRIKDIADHVGVSATTVSNVLHGKGQRVSAETRKRIEAAIKEMGYVPSMGALMLAQEKSGMIGVILFDKGTRNEPALTDPYYGSLIGYLDQCIKERQHYMLMLTVSNVEQIIHQVKAWKLDGLVACNLQPEVLEHLYSLCQKPIVSLDAYQKDRELYININTDDFGGGYQMGQYLAAMGHRRVLMVSDNDVGVDHQRWLGFKKGMEDAGVPVSEEQHLIVSNLYEERLVQYRQQEELLRRQTAVFFASDYYALEGCSVFQRMEIRIPEDLSVTGFDDLIYSMLATPRLTTVRQNIEQKARLTIDALFCLMEEGEERDRSRKWLLPVELIERESVKNIQNRNDIIV